MLICGYRLIHIYTNTIAPKLCATVSTLCSFLNLIIRKITLGKSRDTMQFLLTNRSVITKRNYMSNVRHIQWLQCFTFDIMNIIIVCSFPKEFKHSRRHRKYMYRKHINTFLSHALLTPFKDGFGSKFCALCLRMIFFKREITRLVFWTTRNSDKHYQAH